MKKIYSIFLAAFIILGCTACSSNSSGEYPVKLAGYTINEKPDSIVCLSDSVADILIACGYSDRISARSDECTQSEISGIPSVGSKDKPNSQKIFDVNPDIVFADKTIDSDTKDKIENGGVSVLTMVPAENGEELTRLYENICAVADGNISGREKGSEKSNSILLTMSDLQRIVPESDIVVTACYIYDLNGNAATEKTLSGKLLSYAGLTNVCAISNTSDEGLNKIKLSNPDFIFCAQGLKEKISDDSNFKNLKAIRNKNVYEIDSLLIERQGNSLTEVISFMIETVYPELSNTKKSSDVQQSNGSSNIEASNTESSQQSEETSSIENSQQSEETSSTENSQQSEETSSTENSQQSSESSTEASKVSADNSLEITENLAYGLGEQGSDITKIQQRLKDLGYFDDDPTGYFGELSSDAFKAFEKANNLEEDGYASTDDLKLLFSENVKPSAQ